MPLPARAATIARTAAVLAILVPATLACVPLPHGGLFLVALAAVEWGHWLAPPAALLFVSRALKRRRIGRVELALAAAIGVLLWPTWSASRLAAELPRSIDEVVGPSGLGEAAGFSIARLYAPPDRGPAPLEIDAGNGHRYDLYRPSSGPSAPLLVMVHGGSWRGGSRRQLPDVDHDLVARGLAVLEIEYGLAPAHTFPDALADVHHALAWVVREGPAHGLDPTRVVVAGRSAGAQLALCAAYASPPLTPRGVVALYAPTDLVWSVHNPGPKVILDTIAILGDYLGGPLDGCGPAYELASPLRQVRRGAPPTLLIHGARDRLVNPAHAHRLAGVLSNLGVRHVHLELPWGRHGAEANPHGPGGQVVLEAIERFARAVCR